MLVDCKFTGSLIDRDFNTIMIVRLILTAIKAAVETYCHGDSNVTTAEVTFKSLLTG